MKTLEWKSTITETNYSLDGLKSRMEMTEEGVHELEDRSRESMQSKQQSKKTGESGTEGGKRELGYNMKKFKSISCGSQKQKQLEALGWG